MTATQNDIDLLADIQNWYASECNGDWEHTYGITISNIDNPGWSLKVELIDTYLYKVDFEEVQVQREEEDDWLQCNVKDGEFQGYGGTKNLSDLLRVFLNWAEENQE